MIFLIVRYNESRSWSCPDYTDYSVKNSLFPDYTDYADYTTDYRLQIIGTGTLPLRRSIRP